jgi:hypothetical protein
MEHCDVVIRCIALLRSSEFFVTLGTYMPSGIMVMNMVICQVPNEVMHSKKRAIWPKEKEMEDRGWNGQYAPAAE